MVAGRQGRSGCPTLLVCPGRQVGHLTPLEPFRFRGNAQLWIGLDPGAGWGMGCSEVLWLCGVTQRPPFSLGFPCMLRVARATSCVCAAGGGVRLPGFRQGLSYYLLTF
eukprot:scaffold27643_cov129-Isochrysis_galbana.AAC.1